jgi:membrane associated rhomboid family serine protease
VIPLRDLNPTRRTAYVTYGLIAACFVVFLYELSLQVGGGGEASLDAFLTRWGAVPDGVTTAVERGQILSSATFGLVSSQFLHAGWLHILGNMLYLWIFGNNIEDRLGPVLYLLFYLAAGIGAGLTQVVIDPHSTVPLVGASGAIAGVLGAYLVLYPGARVLSLVFLGYFITTVNVPAVITLGLWFLLQLITGVASLGAPTAAGGGVATFAHVGGFVAGMAVGLLLRIGRAGATRMG